MGDDNVDYIYSSALGLAVVKDDLEMVKLLLKYKANPNCKVDVRSKHLDDLYNHGLNATWHEFGKPDRPLTNIELTQFIISSVDDCYYKESLLNITKNQEIINLLINAGADVNVNINILGAGNSTFFTSIAYSMDRFYTKEQEEYIKYLVEKGGDIYHHCEGDDEWSLFDTVICAGSLDLIEFFISHGIKLDTSHLAVASEAGRLDISEYFLKKLKK